MSDTDSKVICKSIFKDGESATSKEKFTKAWIHLINQLEKTTDSTLRQTSLCQQRTARFANCPYVKSKKQEG